MSKVTITGVDRNGNRHSETFEVLEPNRTIYALYRYKQLETPKPGLHFAMQVPSWRKRLMRFFGFRKWRTVMPIHQPPEENNGNEPTLH